jgi:hypothetical protein
MKRCYLHLANCRKIFFIGEKAGASSFVLEVIKEGFKLPLKTLHEKKVKKK